MHKVSVIIPYHQPIQDLEACLRALDKTMLYPIYELILVNDCPPEEHHPQEFLRVQAAQMHFPIRIIESKERKGFAHTCNAGADAAKGELLAFLNSDTVPMGGWLDSLLEFLDRHPCAGVLGSKLLFPGSYTIQHVGGAFDDGMTAFHPYLHTPGNLPFTAKNRNLQWITGASYLVSKKDFERLGGFDCRYGSTYEDNDFCFKMRFELGKEVWMVADSILLHRAGGSGLKDYEGFRNRNFKLFIDKWGNRIRADELDIYESDGFSPEFLKMLVPLGLSRQFGLIWMLLRAFRIEHVEQQERYVREKGFDGFIDDIAVVFANDFPTLLMKYPSLFLKMVQREGAIQDISGALAQMSSTELFTILQRSRLTDGQRIDMQEVLFKKLDAESFSLSLYNLASFYISENKIHSGKKMLTVLVEMMRSINGEIAGKALYKLSTLTGSKREREDLLKDCLSVYPAHQVARQELRESELAQAGM
jgi:GT2 family glycosyltransferase